MKQPITYMMASGYDGVLYIGVTGNITERVWQHKQGAIRGFTKRYHVHRLVYYESHPTMYDAIRREKYLKHQSRQYKVNLIASENPQWYDLYPSLLGSDKAD